jgi:predicted SAM-dependent methyltransferase
MSETALARPLIQQFLTERPILDVGFGGTAVHPEALTMDMPVGYCPSLEGHKQFFKGDARDLSFLCDETIAVEYSSHLCEDMERAELISMLKEWRRVLKTGGTLITVCPDQQVYLRACRLNGSLPNQAHRQHQFSLSVFNGILKEVGEWETLMEIPLVNHYSFISVVKKI